MIGCASSASLGNPYRNSGFCRERYRSHLAKGDAFKREARTASQVDEGIGQSGGTAERDGAASTNDEEIRRILAASDRCAVEGCIQNGDQSLWTTAVGWIVPRRSPGDQVAQNRVEPGLSSQ